MFVAVSQTNAQTNTTIKHDNYCFKTCAKHVEHCGGPDLNNNNDNNDNSILTTILIHTHTDNKKHQMNNNNNNTRNANCGGPDLGVRNALAHARCSPGEVLSDSKEFGKGQMGQLIVVLMIVITVIILVCSSNHSHYYYKL